MNNSEIEEIVLYPKTKKYKIKGEVTSEQLIAVIEQYNLATWTMIPHERIVTKDVIVEKLVKEKDWNPFKKIGTLWDSTPMYPSFPINPANPTLPYTPYYPFTTSSLLSMLTNQTTKTDEQQV